jgi:hypothetical protein
LQDFLAPVDFQAGRNFQLSRARAKSDSLSIGFVIWKRQNKNIFKDEVFLEMCRYYQAIGS